MYRECLSFQVMKAERGTRKNHLTPSSEDLKQPYTINIMERMFCKPSNQNVYVLIGEFIKQRFTQFEASLQYPSRILVF